MILAAALSGPILALALARRLNLDSLSWTARLMLWVLASAILLALLQNEGSLAAAFRRVGLGYPKFASLLWGLGGMVGLTAAAGGVTLVQRLAGLPIGDRESYERIVATPAGRRTFAVFTAAVVEEFLYRGVGIGVGAMLFGVPSAAVISTILFSLAHFRWRAAHLMQVTVSGAIFAGLFWIAGADLWSCIVAHLLVDGLGFLLMPAIMKARTARRPSEVASGPPHP